MDRWTVPFAALALVLLAACGSGEQAETLPVSEPLRPMPLRVTIVEDGSLEALDYHTIASEVEGRVAIQYIVDEGVEITAEDVADGRLLVRLDASAIEERIDSQESQVTSARAALDVARSNLEIQLHQNASDLRKADLDVRFAELDLQRYVGETLGALLLDEDEPFVATVAGGGEGTDGGTTFEALRARMAALLEDERLHGEALQRRRELFSEIQLAEEEKTRAESKHSWSKRLEEKGYISREELDADRMAAERRRVELERARTALEQYATYDFPKEVENLLSSVVEARDQLHRARKKAEAAETRARREVREKEELVAQQEERLAKYRQQHAATEIRADRPGMIVYASSGNERRWRDDDRIQKGTEVRQSQAIIRIPGPGSMGASISVHETVVGDVHVGQPARVFTDASPNRALDAVVHDVARLPNAADRWLNPDLKVYTTTVRLLDAPPGLKPGMSARVEIMLDELDGVLAVPIQAVGGRIGEPKVWVQAGDGFEERSVVLGKSNDRLVEIREGVAAGERVLLAPPRVAPPEGGEATEDGEGDDGPAAEGEGDRGEQAEGEGGPPGDRGERPGAGDRGGRGRHPTGGGRASRAGGDGNGR